MKPQRWYEKTEYGYAVYSEPYKRFAISCSMLFGVNTLREVRAMYSGFALAPIWGE